MKKLQSTKKITLATLKAFARRNSDSLYHMTTRKFNGQTDCEDDIEMDFMETEITDNKRYYETGIQGIYTVGSSRDYFRIYEDNNYFGISVSNCCGKTILAVKK